MDFVQLQQFKVIAEYEHITNAANALHIAQPALSRTLKNLEKELGLLLFEREGKNIRLNENGRILLHYTNNILNEIDEAKRILADKKDIDNRQVSLSMSAATQLLPRIIYEFRKKNPEISIMITQQKNNSPADVTDKCDILVSADIQASEKANCIILAREEICLAMPTSNPLSSRKSVALAEVTQAPFICLHKGSRLRTITDSYCKKAGFKPHIALESDNPSIVRDLIALGVGMAFIPKLSWTDIDYGPEVSLVDIAEPHCVRYIYMTWNDKRYISSSTKIFQKHLINFFGNLENGGRV